MYLGLWAVGTLHSTATLSIQRVSTVCMSSGSCTVSIFSSPATATLAKQAVFFSTFISSNPNLTVHPKRIPAYSITFSIWIQVLSHTCPLLSLQN
ncbi:uncharacterized protein F5147DRAFT_4379 [Suillus discolor]|uniref:Uncharacterized protein n=1 Tax=Suillus discolor TaxID=1912936 RepID=A0A9P7FJH3_9AGAM|nr:uncharacterized protein F5147DRAFT_4379 [Suillus discolor]KAG2120615.1 hypothetical protein F5147DRAFT_4379 [Suillus discolor]